MGFAVTWTHPGALSGCAPPGQSPAGTTSLAVGFGLALPHHLLALAQVPLIFSHTGSCLRVVAFRGGSAGFTQSPAPAAVPVLREVPARAALPLSCSGLGVCCAPALGCIHRTVLPRAVP